jgi:tight adherence protein C
MDWLAYIAPFAAIVLAVYGSLAVLGKRHSVRKRIADPDKSVSPVLLRREEVSSPLKEWVAERLSASGQWALKDPEGVSGIRPLLIHAGFRHPSALPIFYGIKAVIGLLLPIPILLMALMSGRLQLSLLLMLAFLFGGLGFFLPQFFLQRMARGRQERIDRSLPDVIDLLIICMEAGLALQAALNRVAEEIRDVCKDFYQELQLTVGEMRTGIDRERALHNLGHRTGVDSVRSLVTLIIQSDKLGASIVQALRVHADFTRAQRTLRAEEQAAKMPLKILMPLVFFIFPCMFVVIIGPGVIQIAKALLPALSGGAGPG